METIKIAIDGPAGAGKSTISKIVAKELDYIYIDTGAMFRSLAWKALKCGIEIKSEENKIEEMLQSTKLDISRINGEQVVYVDGQNVSGLIRTPEVSKAASDIAVIAAVRAWLLKTERELASKYNCIMDGRDIGTAVLPDADVKIFLTASAEERAARRHKELCEKGMNVAFEDVLSEMKYRDEQDMKRETAPLTQAPDATVADTTGLTFDESVKLVTGIIKKAVHDV